MDISVDTITTSPTSLLLGCVVQYGKGGPVRFAKITIPFETIPGEVILELLRHQNTSRDDLVIDDPLF